MLAWIREKFGKGLISLIIASISLVFVFYGVFSPKATRGLHEGAVAGTVNGDAISVSELSRAFAREVESYKAMVGGKLTDEQIKAFRIKEAVFKELVKQKLLSQESKRLGLAAADEQIKEKIKEIPAFLKESKFNLPAYREVLAANHYTPASFERLVGDDLAVQKWPDFFKKRLRVSDQELREEFEVRQDQRKIKYILLEQESSSKGFQVGEADLKKFLSDSPSLNLAKAKFDQGKDTVYKGQKFEVVQEGIAREIILGEKFAGIQKSQDRIIESVLAKFASRAPSDAELNLILKPISTQVKTTDWVTRQTSSVPGVGSAQELLSDAFREKSSIDLSGGGKAKRYNLGGKVLLAWVVESKKPNWDELSLQRETLMGELSSRKFSGTFDSWIKTLNDRAKIETNKEVVSAE
jgi:hypothetical protein